jgi:hypothetical protein
MLQLGIIMKTQPDSSNLSSDLIAQSEDMLSESYPKKNKQLQRSEDSQPVFYSSLSRIFSGSPRKLIVAGLILAGILTIFFVFSQGSHFCLLSYCLDNPIPPASVGNDFLAFSGGTAALVLLTTLMGTPLLPAIGISAGIWFLFHMSLH